MAITLQQMRDFLRVSLDLEEEDLPDSLIDPWVREGSRRVQRAETRWPFYETVFAYTLNPNAFGLYPLSGISATIERISSITLANQGPLKWIGFDAFSELNRTPSTGRPIYWSQWGTNLMFYPAVDVAYSTVVAGYVKPADWVALGAGAVPDMPDELHNTIMTWALAKAYAQQEDPEMASFYERQYADELNEFRRRLNVTPPPQPLVLNGGVARDRNQMLVRPRFDWEAAGN